MRLSPLSPGFLILGLIATAPAGAIPMPPAPAVTNVEWLPGSTVRVGDSLNALFRISLASGDANEMWMNIDCHTQQKTLLFMDVQAKSRPPLRVYGMSSISRYMPGVPFEPDADSLFATKPELDLCQKTIPEPRWAGLSSADEQADRLYVDVNNSLRDERMLKVRLATDYARVYRDEKYAAPWSMKIDDMMFNCETGEGMALNHFALDKQFVTDSETPIAAKFTPLAPPLAKVAKTLCSVKDLHEFTGTGPLVAREKTLAENQLTPPDFPQNEPGPIQRYPLGKAAAERVSQAMTRSDQHPGFTRLTYTQHWADDASETSVTRIDVLPDGSTLTLDTLTLGNVTFYAQYQRLFNIVNIREWDSMNPAPVVGQTLESNFSLPPQPGREYRWQTRLADGKNAGKEKTKSQVCQAQERWQSASALSPRFSGRYLELRCTDDRGDGKAMSSDYAWIEDLRVFIRIGYQEEGQKKRFTFSDVSVLR